MKEKRLLKINKNFTKRLIFWFKKNKRELPWRIDRTLYTVWISEIMLQQTVIKAVIPYYKRWLKKYPDIFKLAKASESEVLVLWEGLGYYSRVKNILNTAKLVVKEYKGYLPENYDDLIALPGVGDYTARAILSLAYNKPYPVLDANVKRVIRRVLLIKKWNKENRLKSMDFLDSVISKTEPGLFNESIMEIGQRICLLHNPLCDQCPIVDFCQSYHKNLQHNVLDKKRRSLIRKESILLILVYNKQLLLVQKEKGVLSDLWLFPSIIKTEKKDKDINKYIINNIASEFSLCFQMNSRVHYYTQYADRLYPYVFMIHNPYLPVKQKGIWISFKDLNRYSVPSVYRRILDDFLKNNLTYSF